MIVRKHPYQLFAILFSCIILLTSSTFDSSLLSQNILVNETFDDPLILPDGWGQQTLANDGGWSNGNNSSLQSEWWSIDPHGNFIATNDDACDCNKSEDYLITPPLNFTDLDNAILSFAGFFLRPSF